MESMAHVSRRSRLRFSVLEKRIRNIMNRLADYARRNSGPLLLVDLALTAAVLGYARDNEHRLTKVETILEIQNSSNRKPAGIHHSTFNEFATCYHAPFY